MNRKTLLSFLVIFNHLLEHFPVKVSFTAGELFKDADVRERKRIVKLLTWMKEEGLIKGTITETGISDATLTSKSLSVLLSEKKGGGIWFEEIKELVSNSSVELMERAAVELISLLGGEK